MTKLWRPGDPDPDNQPAVPASLLTLNVGAVIRVPESGDVYFVDVPEARAIVLEAGDWMLVAASKYAELMRAALEHASEVPAEKLSRAAMRKRARERRN
jgi:hypothetical protein